MSDHEQLTARPRHKRIYDIKTQADIVARRVDVSSVYGLQTRIQLILDRFLPYGALTHRTISHKTKANRASDVHRMFRELKELGFKLQCPTNLKDKHVISLVRSWEEKGKSAARMQNDLSVLRWFTECMCKPAMVKSLDTYLLDPGKGKRKYSAQRDKSWTANEVDVNATIEKVRAFDPVTAMQLELMAAFGLRPKEAVMFKPAKNVFSDEIKLRERGNGTKGGRARLIPIEGEYQREVLERAKGFARKLDGSVAHEDKTLAQEQRRFYHVLEACGITGKLLEVTAYGLRHQYAHVRIETLSDGLDAPVKYIGLDRDLHEILNSGDESRHAELVGLLDDLKTKSKWVPLKLNGEMDVRKLEAARLTAMESMGHSRLSVSSAYAGSYRNLSTLMNMAGKILKTDYRKLTVKEIAGIAGRSKPRS